MTKSRRPQPDIGTVVETVVRKQGFSSMSSLRIPADFSKFQKELGRMMKSQLSGGTYLYFVTRDEGNDTFSIEKYGKHEYL